MSFFFFSKGPFKNIFSKGFFFLQKVFFDGVFFSNVFFFFQRFVFSEKKLQSVQSFCSKVFSSVFFLEFIFLEGFLFFRVFFLLRKVFCFSSQVFFFKCFS